MITGRVLAAGSASAMTCRLVQPLSFWGGVDSGGFVSDSHHPQKGVALAGTVLLLRQGRGSSSSSSVLAELIRTGAAPVAIILAAPDAIITLGAIVAAELYDIRVPVVLVSEDDHRRIPDHGIVSVIAEDGAAIVSW